MSLGIIEAIKMNKIINPPTNTKNKLNPTHTDSKYFDVFNAITDVTIIKIRIIVLGLFQFIRFKAIIVNIEINKAKIIAK